MYHAAFFSSNESWVHGNFCLSANASIKCCLSDSGSFSHLPCKLEMAAGVIVVEAALTCWNLATEEVDCLANCLNIVCAVVVYLLWMSGSKV